MGLEAESKLELVLMVVEDAEVSSPEPELPAHDVSFITETYCMNSAKCSTFNVTINCHSRSPTGTEHQFGENVQLTSTSKPVKSG